MPSDFQVFGPTPVQILIPGGTYTELGVTSANFRPQWEVLPQGVEVFADDTGDEVADVIYTGLVGSLSFVLEKYDPTVLGNLQGNMPGGDSDGDALIEHGIIGSLWRTGGYQIGVRFYPSISGKTQYTFTTCVPIRFGLSDLGNSPAKLACEFRVLRTLDGSAPAAGDEFFTSGTV